MNALHSRLCPMLLFEACLCIRAISYALATKVTLTSGTLQVRGRDEECHLSGTTSHTNFKLVVDL